MNLNNKIFWHIIFWAAVTAGVFFFGLPKLAKNLQDLQNSHTKQITELNDLKNHAKGIQLMQSDLSSLKMEKHQPQELFTSDIQLVNEIKHVEAIAGITNLQMDPLGVSGSTDKALAYPSKSGLVQIPFTVTLHGDFPSTLTFLKYFEHNYFVSPINGLSLAVTEKGIFEAKILSNFYLRK